jgi:UDP-N-acetylglucosamine--N-acetylmuramyl-(pentapeptide) pyrophosphoryl-undecaprenol N-acetylglucosamine transferase
MPGMMMNKKVMIATGGTGGHIYPAIALAQQLVKEIPLRHLLFVGGHLSQNPYFDRNVFPYRSVVCASFARKNPLALMSSFTTIARGIWQSLRLIKEFHPDLIVGFGSYYTFPTLVAAKISSVPFILHEANSIPGKVNRFLSQYAVVTGIHFPHTATLLKGKTVEVGMPLRDRYQLSCCTKKEAREYFHLNDNLQTLLVFGGSHGAQAINHLASQAILNLKSKHKMQVLHFTGETTSAESIRAIYEQHGLKACVKAFEERMDLAWRAADMMISRSGAGTIAEQLEFEVPGILIPFPQAADNHQEFNADFMVDIVGGAIKLREKDLDSELLEMKIVAFMDEKKAGEMRQAIQSYKSRAMTRSLSMLIKDILGNKCLEPSC